MNEKYAVIDIGSNSVRMRFQDSFKRFSSTTRLGLGLAQSGSLAPDRAKHSASVIKTFVREAAARGFVPLAYATSAVRDAKNRDEFLELIRLFCGIEVDVLSGEREAQYAYMGACGDKKCGLMDIGGASMQFVSENFKKSFPVGCVRGRDIALERTKDAPTDYSAQRAALESCLEELTAPYADALGREAFAPCIGVGGTITTLCALSVDRFAMSKAVGDGASLSRDTLEELIDFLLSLGNGRSGIGVLASRHDVILYGAALLAKAMDILSLDSITSSLRDGLDGYLDAAVRGEIARAHG